MTDLLNITKTQQGPVTVLHFEGNLDGQTENIAVERVRQEMKADARYVLIDLSTVGMVTSAGLRGLHTMYKLLTPIEEMQAWENEHPNEVFKSEHFKLAGASSQVHYVLSIAGFLQNIYIFPTLQEALSSFTS